MDWNQKTISTYDKSASKISDYFAGYGSRLGDIELGINLAGAGEYSRVVEIGCGDGRDAAEIIPRVKFYVGIDPSRGLLEIAKTNIGPGYFIKDDALNYAYPSDLDVVFAFASLLHVSKDDLKTVFKKVHASLVTGGIFYISLKEADQYIKTIKKDEYGERLFYLYSTNVIEEIAGIHFVTVFEDHQIIGSTNWFTIALKKI